MSASDSGKLARYRPNRGFIAPASALSWIAFGSALPEYIWDKALYPGASLWPWLRPDNLKMYLQRLSRGDDGGRPPPQMLIDALERRVPWEQRVPQATYQAEKAAGAGPRVRDRLPVASAEQMKTAAAEWNAELDTARIRPDVAADALDGASSTLRRAARQGEIAVFIYLETLEDEKRAWVEGRGANQNRIMRVPAARFDEPLFFSSDGFALAGEELEYIVLGSNPSPSPRNLHFPAALDGSEVWERWPNPDPQRVWTVPDSAPTLSPPANKESAPRRAGGRPPHKARDTFIRELIRLANLPDGLPDSTELFHHMVRWCESELEENAPTETTVRQWLADLRP